MRDRSFNVPVALFVIAVVALQARALQAQLFTSQPALLFFKGTADAMTAGPDGNVWFVDRSGNALGRLTPGGDFTSFPVPTANAGPVDIETGPDGNLWFAEENAGKIGRITPQGTITEFPVPGAQIPNPGVNGLGNPGMNGLAFGADGNVWFIAQPTGSTSYSLGKMQLDGTFLGLVPMGSGVHPIKIAAGPAGAIWFRDLNANSVGSVAPDGTVQVYNFKSADPFKIFPSGSMTLGPDGNLWTSHANALARVDVGGVITEYPVTGAEIGGVTTGGDGNIWFADYHTGKIGRLMLSTATDQGTATIDQTSAAVAFQPGELILLRSPVPPANAEAVTLDTSPCPGMSFVTTQTGMSGATVGALVENTTDAPTECADLEASYSEGLYRGNRVDMVWHISDLRVVDVDATVTATLGEHPPIVEATISGTPCNVGANSISCKTHLFVGGSGVFRVAFPGPLSRAIFATVSVESNLPDPNPDNNQSQGAMDPSIITISFPDPPLAPPSGSRH